MVIDKEEWKKCQEFERKSWGDQIYLEETNGEVIKQNTYAFHLGLLDNGFPINLENKKILDVGAGPVSLLLRSENFKKAVALEPLFYSEEVDLEYSKRGILLNRIPAEEMKYKKEFDEIWMYNCLQHVMSPVEILEKIKKAGNFLRIFEWINIEPHEGHPHLLTEDFFVEILNLSPEDYRIEDFNTELLRGKAIIVLKSL